MQSSEFPEFTKQLTKHFELYPGAQMSQATISAWWDDLVDVPFASVVAGLERTRSESHDKLPSCPKVKAIAAMHAQMAFDASRRQKLLVAKAKEEGCTLSPDSPWMKLATYWEQENEHWAKHPISRPEDANDQRFRQFWKMWDNVDKGLGAKPAQGEVAACGTPSTEAQ